MAISKKTLSKYYGDKAVTDRDKELFRIRSEKALFWLKEYAPEEFRYTINVDPVAMEVSELQQKAIDALKSLISSTDLDAIEGKELNQKIYDDVIRGVEIDGKEFFKVVYQKLITRDQGPRLPMFLKEIGRDRLLHLL